MFTYLLFLKALLHSFILATFPTHLNFLGLIPLTILGERYKLTFLIMEPSHSPFSFLLGPNASLKILFSDSFSLHSCVIVRDRVSQPYSTQCSILIINTEIFKYQEQNIILYDTFLNFLFNGELILDPKTSYRLSAMFRKCRKGGGLKCNYVTLGT